MVLAKFYLKCSHICIKYLYYKELWLERYKVLHFIRGVGLIKGYLKGEAQQIIEGRGARA
jgi:hypothetical protein